MRAALTIAVVAAAAAVAVLLLYRPGGGGPSPVPAGGGDGRLERRFEDLTAENARHAQAVARLERELAELRESVRALLARPPAGPNGEAADPADLLDRYVASFAAGGEGSKYYELAVDAAAPALVEKIGAIVGDADAHPLLRQRLAAMLGTPRFKGDDRAVRILLDGVRAGRPEALAGQALAGLTVIGDRGAAAALESMAWALPREVLESALQAIVQLSGDAGNRALVRLLASAPDEAARVRLVARATSADPAGALELFRLALRMEKPVRLAAAHRLREFRDSAAKDLVRSHAATEDDPDVKRALEEAAQAQSAVPRWHALKATGAPDVDDVSRDHPNAWASKAADGGTEWLELTYARPMRASAVRIHEVLAAGAVVRVEAVPEGGGRFTVWEGEDPLDKPGVFEAAFPTTDYRVRKFRVILDTRRTSGWNEIDTVELVGPDGRAWPVDAVASSSYAD